MTKLARSIAATAACLAIFGIGTAGVAGAAVGAPIRSGPQTSIDKSLKPTSIPLKATKSAVAPNQKVTLTGFLKSGHTPVANAPVTLESRQPGGAFTVVSIKTTDSNGKVTLVVAPRAKSGQKVQYELVFAGDTTYRGSHSQVITLPVS